MQFDRGPQTESADSVQAATESDVPNRPEKLFERTSTCSAGVARYR
jgi:hypothetical protein